MTRFDADTPEERQKLYAEAIEAHRERGSAFATFEGDATDDDAEGTSGSEDSGGATDETPPWVQFGDGVLNLDCTESELDALKGVLEAFPAFKIDDLHRPEEAEGVNVRVSALADPNRVAQCIERLFRDVYDRPEDARVWVTTV